MSEQGKFVPGIEAFKQSLIKNEIDIRGLDTLAQMLTDPSRVNILTALTKLSNERNSDELSRLNYALRVSSLLLNNNPLLIGYRNLGYVAETLFYGNHIMKGQQYEGEDIDTCIDNVLLKIYAHDARNRFKDLYSQLLSTDDIHQKLAIAALIKELVPEYISRLTITCDKWREKIPATWEELTDSFDLNCTENFPLTQNLTAHAFDDAVREAHATFESASFNERIDQIPHFDWEQFNTLRLSYGAKAAVLMIMRDITQEFNTLLQDTTASLRVPEFTVIPVDIFEKYRQKEDIEEDLKPYYAWTRQLNNVSPYHLSFPDDEEPILGEDEYVPYIVRSSAVHSEDGENLTGAGIYTSVAVENNEGSFDHFKAAVLEVYASVYTDVAIEYRRRNGIEDEQMGIVIQRFIDSTEYSQTGYINTSTPGVPQLMDINLPKFTHYLNKKRLSQLIGLDSSLHEVHLNSIHHYKPDIDKVKPNALFDFGRVAHILEKFFEKPIQIEFAAKYSSMQLFQVRPMPEDAFAHQDVISFLPTDEIHSGSAIGVGDLTLPILDTHDNNLDKEGIILFYGNDEFTIYGRESSFPKKGAVVITTASGRNGHIQTICAEMGLICIYARPDIITGQSGSKLRHSFPESETHVRVIANGMEGRIYLVNPTELQSE